MTAPLHTADLLSPKCRVDAGLGTGRQPDWILDRISGNEIMNSHTYQTEPFRRVARVQIIGPLRHPVVRHS